MLTDLPERWRSHAKSQLTASDIASECYWTMRTNQPRRVKGQYRHFTVHSPTADTAARGATRTRRAKRHRFTTWQRVIGRACEPQADALSEGLPAGWARPCPRAASCRGRPRHRPEGPRRPWR
ncbi:hypothetical protein BIW11_13294 [Tropilaelaps mercedesae]|uniref:Uncharacterized protein n=1 Tax=Tropilaelaps mercedesae TaxID=418985 RepID=A0A1V9X340_9ACAR|nr:hypothetical protein BIW11_13294 [Tropilaelaps mercedesae]